MLLLNETKRHRAKERENFQESTVLPIMLFIGGESIIIMMTMFILMMIIMIVAAVAWSLSSFRYMFLVVPNFFLSYCRFGVVWLLLLLYLGFQLPVSIYTPTIISVLYFKFHFILFPISTILPAMLNVYRKQF